MAGGYALTGAERSMLLPRQAAELIAVTTLLILEATTLLILEATTLLILEATTLLILEATTLLILEATTGSGRRALRAR